MEEINYLNKYIDILSDLSNYYAKNNIGRNAKTRNGKAVKLLSEISYIDAVTVFNNENVIKTIFSIENTEILRTIFRKVPPFFQEMMINNEEVLDRLLAPKELLTRKRLFDIYKNGKLIVSDDAIRKIEVFLHSIKNPILLNKIVDNQYFQMLVVLFGEKRLNKAFFKDVDTVRLFNNITNDRDLYNEKTSRETKRNILNLFNNISPYYLLTPDYKELIEDKGNFVWEKRRRMGNNQIIIEEKSLEMMNDGMINILLGFNNIDKNIIINYLDKKLHNKINNNEFDFNKDLKLVSENGYHNFNRINSVYVNLISQKYMDNLVIRDNFINYLYSILFGNNDNISYDTELIIKDAIFKKIISNRISDDDYITLLDGPNSIKSLFYLKFGKASRRMDYLKGISFDQIMKLNVRHINQILKLIDSKYEDEVSSSYGYAIKLYMAFGLERTLKILKNDYGKLNNYFDYNVNKLDVSKIPMIKEGKKYIPQISTEFNNFMFAKQNDNHFINMLMYKDGELNKNWSNLFNNFDKLKEKCHGVITLRKLEIIFKEEYNKQNSIDLKPDDYKIEDRGVLPDIMLGNKTHNTNKQIYDMVIDTYNKMKQRTESSIPYVKGTASNGYKYEMMRFDDPIIFALGYKAGCCFRTGDIAYYHLLHSALCRNGRILIIYDENGNFSGFSPLKRNGEVLIANSIECAHRKGDQEDTVRAFSEAINDIVSVSQSNKEDKHPINLVCIGTESYVRPLGNPFPSAYPTPTIYEKDDPKYRNTDIYHQKLTIIYQNPTLNLRNIIYGDPKVSYMDPRPEVRTCDFSSSYYYEQSNALKVINAIRYSNSTDEEKESFKDCNKKFIIKCIYNDDWYILLANDGEVYGDYLKFDKRAEEEYNIALERFKEKFSDKTYVKKYTLGGKHE